MYDTVDAVSSCVVFFEKAFQKALVGWLACSLAVVRAFWTEIEKGGCGRSSLDREQQSS